MLYLDYETFSALDLRKVSLDRYSSHPSTRILLCAYAFDDGPVECWEEGQELPIFLHERMTSSTCVAWNVSFERAISAKVWRLFPKWRDAMVAALYAGLPAGLKDCNRVPFFSGQSETSKETLLINKFCKPSKNGQVHDRNTDPEDWAAFVRYCKADVADTRLIMQWVLSHFDIPERVEGAWELDQTINLRGMPVDRLLTFRAWENAQRLQAECAEKLKTLTGLENPNSCKQLLGWLTARGFPYTSMGKELVTKALNEDPDKSEDYLVDD